MNILGGKPKNNNDSVKLTSLITYLNGLTLDKKNLDVYSKEVDDVF